MNENKIKGNSHIKIRVPALSLDEKIDFFTGFYTYVKASIPVSTALAKTIKYSSNAKIKEVALVMLRSLDNGEYFANIILKFDKALGSAYCHLLSVGMQAGELPQITKDILDALKKIRTLKRNVIKACVYPAIHFLMIFVAIMFLLFYIAPKMAKMAEMMTGSVPPSLKVILGISEFISHTWIILIPLIFFAFKFGIEWLKKSAKNETFIKIPMLGNIIKVYNLSMFSRVLAISYAAGVPITNAYTLSSEVVENTFIKNKLKKCSNMLPVSSLSAAITGTGLFEPHMVSKIESGEISGNIDEMLMEISDDIDEHLSTVVIAGIKVLEPVLMIIVAIFVLIFGLIIMGPANPVNYLLQSF